VKRLTCAIMATAFFLLLWVPSVFAQPDPGSTAIAKARAELERTDQVIERAKDAVRTSSAPVAQVALQYAQKLQEQAWTAFRDTRYQQAVLLTRQAREKAQDAMSRSRVTEQNDDLVLRKLESVGGMIDKVREAIQGGSDAHLRDILQAAQESLGKAWEFYRGQQYRPAIKLTNQVERVLRKVLQQSDRQRRGDDTLRESRERVKETIDDARRVVSECGSDKGMTMLEQAERQYRLALELAEKGSSQAAGKELARVRQMALDAEKECGNLAGLENRCRHLLDLADRLKAQTDPTDESLQKLLEGAYEQLYRAKALIGAAELKGAAAALKAAQMSLNQLRHRLEDTQF
jgi:hypothetical protein